MAVRLFTLMYHDVVEENDHERSGFAGGDARSYKLDLKVFKDHVKMLAQRAGNPIRVTDPPSERGKNWLITFDDGGVSAMTCADILEEFGWHGHFFVTTDFIGKASFLSRSQIGDLHRLGHVVGSHSCSHPVKMSKCSWDDLLREWTVSKNILSDITGSDVRTASVPGGHYSTEVARAASEAGIRILFNSEPSIRPKRVDDCTVIGRFTVQRWTPAEKAAAIAAGSYLSRTSQVLWWNFKKPLKSVGGQYYLRLRKTLFHAEESSDPEA